MLHTIMSGWSIVYIFQKNSTILSLKIDFILANSVDPDEILFMRHSILVLTIIIVLLFFWGGGGGYIGFGLSVILS